MVDNLCDRTRRALEDAQTNARLVERLEEETKKLKELTDSFNEKRMQDEKEMEEIRLRMELEDKEKGYPPRPSPAPVCSPTSPAETSLASCHESDEERVLRLANWPWDHPSPSDGPIAPVGERIDAAIKEIREDRKFHRKRGWPPL